MAGNRLNAPNQFETLPPPWLLSQLDTNATQNQAAWNDSSLGFMNGVPTDTGSTNAYSITLPLGVPSSYRAGMCVSFIPAHTNTGASTLTVSPLGSVAIVNPAGIALQGGEIAANRKLDLIHDGTSFRVVGPCPVNIVFTTIAAATQAVECAGATAVCVYCPYSNVGGLALTLNHLAPGTPVQVTMVNNAGATASFSILATDPGGTAYLHSYIVFPSGAGGFTDMTSSPISLPNGNGRLMAGSTAFNASSQGYLLFT